MPKTKMTEVSRAKLVATTNKSRRFSGVYWECVLACGHRVLSPARVHSFSPLPMSGAVAVGDLGMTAASAPSKLKCRACVYVAQRQASSERVA